MNQPIPIHVADVSAQLAGQVTLTLATEGMALASTTPVATFSDADISETASDFTASINWGDGTTTVGTVAGGNGSFTVVGGHTYADEGSDAVAVTITDTQNSTTITPSGTVTVGEGDLLIAQPVTFGADPGQVFSGTVATFSDDTYPDNVASDFTATIDWGDGTTTAGTVGGGNRSPFTVSGLHIYGTTGIDTVVVTLTDDPPGAATATADSTADVTGQLAGRVNTQLGAIEGTALPITTPLATFTDTNLSDTAGDFTASINWGGGNITSGTVSGGNGLFTVTGGGFTYGGEGTYGLAVTVTDTLDNNTIAPNGAVVVAEGDTLVANPITFSASVNAPFSGTVATFTDPTFPDNFAGDFTALINWGDGTTTGGAVDGGSGNPFTVSGAHTYTTAGIDTVVVTLSERFSLGMVPPGTATATTDSTALVGAVFSPNPPPPAGTTADMILRDGYTGVYEIYDIGNNQILGGYPLGQVGTNYGVCRVGRFQRRRYHRHAVAQQRHRCVRGLRHRQQQHHRRRCPWPGRVGVAGRRLRRFQWP